MKSGYIFAILLVLMLVAACSTEVPPVEKPPVEQSLAAATCHDNIMNQNETEVDCGGPCAPCQTCDDGIQNQGETGVDCGGPCAPCQTCDDGIQNQNETGIDCGGVCKPCPVEKFEIYSGDYMALKDKMKPNVPAVFLKPSLPTGLKIGESYVFALGITNTMENTETFLVNVDFQQARDFYSNPIAVDKDTVLSWFDKNNWSEYKLAQYENVAVPVGVTVGEFISPGVPTKPGTYYFEAVITYKQSSGFLDYAAVDFNFKVK